VIREPRRRQGREHAFGCHAQRIVERGVLRRQIERDDDDGRGRQVGGAGRPGARPHQVGVEAPPQHRGEGIAPQTLGARR